MSPLFTRLRNDRGLMLARAALFLFASLSAGSAVAQPPLSLKETRALEAETQGLSEEVAYTNSVCGLSMSAAVDWPSAWTDIAALIAQCDRALGAVEASCRAGAPKAEIANLTRFVCAGDGAGPAIRGRTFRFGAARGADSFERTRVFIDGLR